jgi:hypothetical protein
MKKVLISAVITSVCTSQQQLEATPTTDLGQELKTSSDKQQTVIVPD